MVASSIGSQLALIQTIEVPVVAGLGMGPPAERVLHAVDEQRRHGDRDGDQQAARDAQAALPEALAGER